MWNVVLFFCKAFECTYSINFFHKLFFWAHIWKAYQTIFLKGYLMNALRRKHKTKYLLSTYFSVYFALIFIYITNKSSKMQTSICLYINCTCRQGTIQCRIERHILLFHNFHFDPAYSKRHFHTLYRVSNTHTNKKDQAPIWMISKQVWMIRT